MSNKVAAGIIAVANSVFPFLVLTGVLDWNAATISAASLVVTNTVTLGGFIFAKNKEAPTS